MLELERLLKVNKLSISLKGEEQITFNVYQNVSQRTSSKETKVKMLKMDPEQQELYDINTKVKII